MTENAPNKPICVASIALVAMKAVESSDSAIRSGIIMVHSTLFALILLIIAVISHRRGKISRR